MIHLLDERYDTKSNVKLGEFRSQLQASYVSSHTEVLWYNETVCLWMTIYIYIYIYILPYPRGVEFSGEEVIVLPLTSTVERMYVNNSNCDY